MKAVLGVVLCESVFKEHRLMRGELLKPRHFKSHLHCCQDFTYSKQTGNMILKQVIKSNLTHSIKWLIKSYHSSSSENWAEQNTASSSSALQKVWILWPCNAVISHGHLAPGTTLLMDLRKGKGPSMWTQSQSIWWIYSRALSARPFTETTT